MCQKRPSMCQKRPSMCQKRPSITCAYSIVMACSRHVLVCSRHVLVLLECISVLSTWFCPFPCQEEEEEEDLFVFNNTETAWDLSSKVMVAFKKKPFLLVPFFLKKRPFCSFPCQRPLGTFPPMWWCRLFYFFVDVKLRHCSCNKERKKISRVLVAKRRQDFVVATQAGLFWHCSRSLLTL